MGDLLAEAGLPAEIIYSYVACSVASVGMFIAAICMFVKKVVIGSRYSSADAEGGMFPVIVLLALACLLGAFPLGFHELFLATGDLAGAILPAIPFGVYDCLTMLLFEGRLDAFYELLYGMDGAYSFASAYLFYLALLYIAAPIAIAVTAVSVFKGRIAWRRTLRLVKERADRGAVYVFEGANDRSLAFVRDLKRRTRADRSSKLPLILFAGVSKDDAEKRSGEIRNLACRDIRFEDANSEYLLGEVFKKLSGRPFLDLHVFFFDDDRGSDLGATISLLRKMAIWTSPLTCEAQPEPQMEKRLSDLDEKIDELQPEVIRLRFTDSGTPRYHVYCACGGRSDEPTLDSMKGVKGIDVRIVDEGREAVYDLFWNHPLHETLPPHYLLEGNDDRECKTASLVVAILGAGEYGFEAFRAVCWLGQIVDVELNVFVIDQMSESDFDDKVDYWCPELRTSDYILKATAAPEEGRPRPWYKYYQATVGKRDFNATLEDVHREIVNISNKSVENGLGKVVPYCIVALGDDDLSTDAAISMRQVFCGDGEATAGLLEPLVFVNIFDYSRHAVIEKMNGMKLPMSLIPFGSIERIFTEDYIVNSQLEALAFAVHRAFLEGKGNEAPKTDEEALIGSYLDYTEWQMNRLSSAANALAMRSKMWAMGLDLELRKLELNPECSGGDLFDDALGRLLAACGGRTAWENAKTRDSFFDSSHQLARMSKAEHDRWAALYLTEGWTRMSPKASLHFRYRGMNGKRHDSHLLMRHPFIAPFGELGEISKLVGKGDTRLNDIRFTSDLGRVLGSPIGYSQQRYSIGIAQDVDPGLYIVKNALEGGKSVYEKKPGTGGFHAFATDQPGFLFHNVLEDGTEESPGVFICGLMGEIWRIEKLPGDKRLEQLAGDFYPEKLNERYVIDDGEAGQGRNIRFDDLLHLPIPKNRSGNADADIEEALRSYTSWEYDFTQCASIRYRQDGDEKPKSLYGEEKNFPETQYVLAAQADSSWNGRCIQGSYTEYWINRECNIWGEKLDHGSGDWIVCSLIDCTDKDMPAHVPRWEKKLANGETRTYCPEIFVGRGDKGKRGRPYVINGNVFELTYRVAKEVKPVAEAER